jgi:FAD/FMN-containing dehydrogenase
MDVASDAAARPLDAETIERFRQIVGPANALSEPDMIAPYLHEPRDLYAADGRLVLRPADVGEVSAILRLASETRTPIVPQGGNTGLVGGQVPRGPGEVVLSLSRLDRIRNVDPVGRTMTVEAGTVLQKVHEAAEEAGLFYPLSLGSQGSCQIGGNLASNAGGTGVLAYGNSRDLCLGIEAVLPSGEVLNGLRRLKKDNRGYDWRQLLIGSEGTLGVITAAVLKLFPKPAGREVAYVGLRSPDEAIALLRRVERIAGGQLTAFELMARIGMEFTLRHTQGARDPMGEAHEWYVLIEISSQRSAEDARETMERVLAGALEAGEVEDAAIAQSGADAEAFWRMREAMSWAQKPEGGSIKMSLCRSPRCRASCARRARR